MILRRTTRPSLLITAALLLPYAAHAAPRHAELYRDTWGVPHVFAETPADAAYALGYAQAEDRVNDIFINVRTAVGRMAEVFGPDHVQRDLVMRLVKNAERCENYWRTAPQDVRDVGDAFVHGVNDYLAKYPERRPPFDLELQGWHCLAVGRAMILNWPIEALFQELARKQTPPPFGSNSFAIAPARSAEGCAILMTDPHLTWEGLAVFYEARVHSPAYDMCGFWIVGSPLSALGHGAHVAWACTTGGPDTADVFALKLNPDNPLQYDMDGTWHDFTAETIAIPVQGQASVEQPALYSELGPVLEQPDLANHVAYAGATPYLTEVRLFEQLIAMVAAENCDSFYDALRMNQLMEQNITFADRTGNIRYARIGNTPIRPDGFDWSKPVPYSRASQWRGTHPLEDLVQLANPTQGYMQNSNNSPEFMLRDSPMTADKYPSYIYHVSWDQRTPRGARLLELLDADASVTKNEAMRYTTDVYDILAPAWKNALRSALKETTPEDPDVARSVERILAWDGAFTRESTAAPIVRYWRLNAQQQRINRKIADGSRLTEDEDAALLRALADAVGQIKTAYGTLDVTWGAINRIGRGGRYFASPGAEFGEGSQMERTETVMDVGTRELEPGTWVAHDGSSAMMLSFLHDDGIESFSIVNWGQSADPDSPHYVDQAEKLYAERTFKPTWFNKKDLLNHVESRIQLDIE